LSDGEDAHAGASEASAKQINGGSKKSRAKSKKSKKPKEVAEVLKGTTDSVTTTTFAASADTEAMLNGLKLDQSAEEGPATDFDELDQGATEVKAADTPTERSHASPVKGETLAERRRREHEEYKKKRDSDPTFIPNRGNFFMHDARAPDQRGFTSYRGRGRGRGGFIGGPFSPAAGQMAQSEKTDQVWAHDLHETLDEPNNNSRATTSTAHQVTASKTTVFRPLNFSSSKVLGKVQVRVCMPGMKAAIPFAGVPVKQHTRLPDHRPPLRRDKPVRMSLPDCPVRYIFPSQDRSFIFIPRSLRPNQQGFGRSVRGPSSRRTSAYGGSVYSPSVAMSRRSSMARERESMFSPAGSMRGIPQHNTRPVVRLPQGMLPGSYPLPQTPAIEHYRETTTMHQPRPQKTISVSGIESPATMALHAPQQQNQQPFENQLPLHIAEGSVASVDGAAPPPYSPYRGQYPSGTPLSNIPERAIHAQPFQPPGQPYGQTFYAQQYAQPGYYYPPAMQVYPASQPIYPVAPLMQVPAGAVAGPAPAGTVPHESNGMVFYIDPSQLPQTQFTGQDQYQGQEAYMPAPSYAVNGMMTPGPEGGYYYGMYYPQQQQ